MGEHSWLVDWIFGDLLFRRRDSVSISVVDSGESSMFVAEGSGCVVIVVYARGPEQSIFVFIVEDGVTFSGHFSGSPAVLDALWSRVLECARALEGVRR